VKSKRYDMMVAILAKAAVWEGCCVVQMNNEDEQPCVLLAMDGGSVQLRSLVEMRLLILGSQRFSWIYQRFLFFT
jgi:hypothetical protein